MTLNFWKKFLAVLVLVCLLANVATVANATRTDEEARQGLDYSELELQIGIANGLNSYDYTAESWEKLEQALEKGNKRLAGIYNQGKLDSAAQEIETAMSKLVKMDYSPLTDALDAVDGKISENPQLHDAWYELDQAVEEAKKLLISGDQQAVDQAAQELNELLQKVQEIPVSSTGDANVVIREVEVEVLPTNDFCNIPSHHVWPVLFIISLALNVLLVITLLRVVKKKQKTTDYAPLVQYDIDDDMDL